jgi:hypothetical protein
LAKFVNFPLFQDKFGPSQPTVKNYNQISDYFKAEFIYNRWVGSILQNSGSSLEIPFFDLRIFDVRV